VRSYRIQKLSFRCGCEWQEVGQASADSASGALEEPALADVSNLTLSPESVPASVVCAMALGEEFTLNLNKVR
jgi:uncharacterized protein (DUF736 family)